MTPGLTGATGGKSPRRMWEELLAESNVGVQNRLVGLYRQQRRDPAVAKTTKQKKASRSFAVGFFFLPSSWQCLVLFYVCLGPPGFHPDVAEHSLTFVPVGPPSDVTAAALLSYWLEPRQPQPHSGVSPPP